VAVVVHGGYWKAQHDRSLMTDLCIDLARHGLAAWNAEYRRVGGGGGWPESFVDFAACVDLLAELDAPLDLERVVAVGHSAGDTSRSGPPAVPLCRTTRRGVDHAFGSRLRSRRPASSTSRSRQG
jgi:hypothetical protein